MKVSIGNNVSLDVKNGLKIPEDLFNDLNKQNGCPIEIHCGGTDINIHCDSFSFINKLRKFMMYDPAFGEFSRKIIFK